MTTWLRVCFVITMLVACGNKGNGNGVDAPGTGSDGGGSGSDGGGPGTDGGVVVGACPPGTTAGTTQCSNCIDDDEDGRVDGFDLECTGPGDNLENSFATGIPGDNKDLVNQDCFFDGDSGSGNDGCNIHVCCLLGISDPQLCTVNGSPYDPAECTNISDECKTKCGAATPPGCDCFGCCTVCDPVKGCFTISLSQAVSPDCTPDQLDNPDVCKTCTKSTVCNGGTCNGTDPTSCILCPGQDPSTLPSSCSGATCPTGVTKCASDGDCQADEFCSNGCCLGVIL